MYLQHYSFSGNEEQILKDGFLRPANKTKVSSLYNQQNTKVFAKWIYTNIDIEVDKIKSFVHFYINPEVLLKTKFVLNVGWKTEDYINKSDIIDGTLLTKKQLNELLNNFKEICKLTYINDDIIGKNKLPSSYSNEILIKDDIDLHKYLVMFSNYNEDNDKVIKKILKNKYPNVKII
jgi:hypothetical protein